MSTSRHQAADYRLLVPTKWQAVPLQGGYLAKLCPVRVQNDQDDALEEVELLEPSEADEARMDAGKQFESDVFRELLSNYGDQAVEVTKWDELDDREVRMRRIQDETAQAMDAGVELILGGWLPADVPCRRTGRPDILVRAGTARPRARYHPVDVKHHQTVSDGDHQAPVSSLTSAARCHAEVVDGVAWRSRVEDDALQLAHYWRMLEACDRAPAGPATGGVLAADRRIWWVDLGPKEGEPGDTSFLARYDELFAERLDVIAHTLRRNRDRRLSPMFRPWWHGECSGCPWQEHCRAELVAEDHVSLVYGIRDDWTVLDDAGCTTRRQLIDVDDRVIALAAALKNTSMPLPDLLDACRDKRRQVALIEVVPARRTRVVATLADAGLHSVGDLRALDRRSVRLATQLPGLGKHVYNARVALSGHPWRIAMSDAEVPRADVEVDVDMESVECAAYLWGTLTTVRTPHLLVDDGYRPFVTWDPLDDRSAAKVFTSFWKWLSALRSQVVESGHTFRVYCYSAAEATKIRYALSTRVRGLPAASSVERFLASDQWVDLLPICRRHIATGAGYSLKTVAPLAGFTWRDDTPGGDASTVWRTKATNGDPDAAAQRQRILDYNEDDVRATLALRDWLDGPARELPQLTQSSPTSTEQNGRRASHMILPDA